MYKFYLTYDLLFYVDHTLRNYSFTMYVSIQFIHFGGQLEMMVVILKIKKKKIKKKIDGQRENLDKYGLTNKSCKCHACVRKCMIFD